MDKLSVIGVLVIVTQLWTEITSDKGWEYKALLPFHIIHQYQIKERKRKQREKKTQKKTVHKTNPYINIKLIHLQKFL